MRERLKRLLPDAERVRGSRWLRWLGPAVHHPRLWHLSRRGVALGFALGVFFGLLVPIAQIPLSVTAAVVLRANIPTAVASTLVTNPVTFAPIYYGAYHIGAALLGDDGKPRDFENAQTVDGGGNAGKGWAERITALGKPLLLGLVILACSMGTLAYLLVSGLWRLKIWFAWHRRRRRP